MDEMRTREGEGGFIHLTIGNGIGEPLGERGGLPTKRGETHIFVGSDGCINRAFHFWRDEQVADFPRSMPNCASSCAMAASAHSLTTSPPIFPRMNDSSNPVG